jgi:uncharacterized damage-inducible protein DinB
MHPALALIHRNAWATERLLNWCQWQPATAAPAGSDVYGTIEASFNHLLAAETRYLRLLTGEMPEDPVSEIPPRTLAELREPGRQLAQRWRDVLETERDIDQARTHDRAGAKVEMPDWVPLVQGVHHGDDHRAQIGTLLGREGKLTPDLDGWFFGFVPSSMGTPPNWAGTMLRRSAGHHLWATAALLEHCRSLSDDQLALSTPGTYGSILDTLHHLVSADGGYLSRLERRGPAQPFESHSLSAVQEHWQRQHEGWLGYLGSEPDHEGTVEFSDGWYPAWIPMLQAIHHGNEHRTHIGTVMLGNAIEAPELDVWAYAAAEGVLREEPAG